MTTFDEFRQDRVIRNASMTLRQENDETLLGPTPGVLAVKAVIVLGIIESLAFVGIPLYFIAGLGGNMMLMVGLLVAIGFVLAPLFVGAIVYDMISSRKKLRFHRKNNGEIVVKDASGIDRTLSGEQPTFSVEAAMDRNGNNIHDVFMQYGGDTYYIVSGHDRNDMTQLQDALQRAGET